MIGKNNKNLNKKSTFKILILIFIVAVLLFLISCVKLFRPSIEQIKKSIVKIETYNINNELESIGSGFCVFNKDFIATNFHVIEGSYSIKIIADDKKEYEVKNIVAFSSNDDLAILKINGQLKPLKINSKDNNKIKDKVIAIGSPKGELNTLSEGIISNNDDNDYIRISVPISHGSSGGVLLNKNYEVIGITNAGYDDAENLNFAIKSKLLTKIYNDFKNGNIAKIDSLNYKECMPNIINFNTKNELRMNSKCDFSNLELYTASLDTFYKLTNSYEIFNSSMYGLRINGFNNNYKKLSKQEQKLASEYYTKLLYYEDCDSNEKSNCSIDNILTWNKEQLIMELNILKTYELAIFEVELENININDIFNYVNSLQLGVPQKAILLLLYGNYTPQELNYNDASKVFNFINNLNLSIKEKSKILKYLGYEIRNSKVYW